MDIPSLITRVRSHAREIAMWREDDEQGPVCIELTCTAEELLTEAANALTELSTERAALTAARDTLQRTLDAWT